MKKFVIEPTKERIVAQAGLAIVGNLLNQTNLVSRLNAYKLPDISRYPACSNGDVAKSYIGLLCQGKSDYDNIETFRDDAFFCTGFGYPEGSFQPDSQATIGPGRLGGKMENDLARRIAGSDSPYKCGNQPGLRQRQAVYPG